MYGKRGRNCNGGFVKLGGTAGDNSCPIMDRGFLFAQNYPGDDLGIPQSITGIFWESGIGVWVAVDYLQL